jgi:hypothetical protein
MSVEQEQVQKEEPEQKLEQEGGPEQEQVREEEEEEPEQELGREEELERELEQEQDPNQHISVGQGSSCKDKEQQGHIKWILPSFFVVYSYNSSLHVCSVAQFSI